MKKSRKILSIFLGAIMVVSLFVPVFGVYALENNIASFNGHTYQRFDESMTWNEAKAYCESLGGYLATITSSAEQEAVKSLIEGGSKAQYWIGGTNEGYVTDWTWVTGEKFEYWADTVSFEMYDNGEYYLQMQRHNWGNGNYLGYWNNANNENHINGEESFYGPEQIGFVFEFGDNEMPNENNAKTPIVYIIGRTAIVTADGQPTIEENTDFIADVVEDTLPLLKDAILNPFYDFFNPLMLEMCYSEEQMTINSDENWPQYLFYDNENGTCTPLTSGNMNTEDYTDNIFSAFFRMIKALWNFVIDKMKNPTKK